MAAKGSSGRNTEAVADACVDVLRDDPPRLKRILREAAGLLDDVSQVLTDARHPRESKQVHLVAKLLRGAALLPAGLAAAGLKKAISKVLAERA